MKQIKTLGEFKVDKFYIFESKTDNEPKLMKIIECKIMHGEVDATDLHQSVKATLHRNVFEFWEIFEVSKEENPEYFL